MSVPATGREMRFAKPAAHCPAPSHGKSEKWFNGKAMELKSSALPDLLLRLKLAINPATRFFLAALFVFGFTSSYFVDLRFKTHPQYAANPDVEKIAAAVNPLRGFRIYARNASIPSWSALSLAAIPPAVTRLR
jgi:hypothetical protein